MNTYIVYKHTNKINGKNYIGITKYGENPNKRWQNGRGYKDNDDFFSDIILYGWNNFTHEILEKNLSEVDALLLEKKYILLYNSIENGYTKGLYGHLSKDSIKKQLQTKQERYGSERGIHSYTNNNKKVKCKETGDIFASISEAERWCNSCKVGECCRGNRKHAGRHPTDGYQLSWEYADPKSIITISCEQDRTVKQILPVQCIETGVIYKNASAASRDTGIAACNILRVCRNERKSAGKLHWIFIKEE